MLETKNKLYNSNIREKKGDRLKKNQYNVMKERGQVEDAIVQQYDVPLLSKIILTLM